MTLQLQPKSKKKTSRFPRPRLTGRAEIRASFGRIRRTVKEEVRRLRGIRLRAAVGASASGSAAALRDVTSGFGQMAAAFHRVSDHVGTEARRVIAEANGIRKTIPKLLEPRVVELRGRRIFVFEFGQPLTAREAFAEALGIDVVELDSAVTRHVGELGGAALWHLPRSIVDGLAAETGDLPLVTITNLRREERPGVITAHSRPVRKNRYERPTTVFENRRQVLAMRGALVARNGFTSMFYLPGTVRLPAGATIAVPAGERTR